jgi:CheY-like chemotaxis protein
MAKILIIDDSNLSRRILRRILETAGHQVNEAEDGMSGLESYRCSDNVCDTMRQGEDRQP